MERMRYAVVFEKTSTGWSAYPPDLLGCVATGRTLELVKRRIRWAIKAHIRDYGKTDCASRALERWWSG